MGAKRHDLSGSLVLGRYRIVQPLARGGMGIVYLARTEGAAGFTRPVVIKRIVPDLVGDEAATQAFVREARILSNLQHPGIVNVIDFDQEDEGAYVMVLEYVHGYNLGQWHKYVIDSGRKFSVDYAVYIMTRVLDALHYAHTFVRTDGTPMQIVHRDVSPGNILVDSQGHVKLLDFGIARANEGGEYKTREGMFKGKLSFAAPEVYDGTSATPRSDVYSAGVVLYQMLAGENPFRGKDMAEIVRRVLTHIPPPIASRRDDVPGELDAVIEKALAKNPDDRYPTAAALADALHEARPRREEEFATDFADDVWNDFNGDMAKKLGLEPLADRDAAWRAAQDGPDVDRARLSSTPPPNPLEGATRTIVEPTPRDTRREAPRSTFRPRQTGRGVWVAGGVGIVAALAGAYAWSTSQRPPPTASRFVVVEKQARAEPSAESAASAASGAAAAQAVVPPPEEAASAAAPSASAPEPTGTRAGAESKASAKPSAPDPAALSRAIQRQRGTIEACFQKHVREVDGRPEVSIRFRVGTSGRVETAELSPGALNGTPLGQCLLAVGRGTDFGPQTEPLSFTIPITARRVSK